MNLMINQEKCIIPLKKHLLNYQILKKYGKLILLPMFIIQNNNAGAGKNVSRNNAFVTSKLPWYLKTNIEIFGLNLKREKIYFTPDRILVFKPFRKVFGCTYRDLHIDILPTNFVESERVQKDSEIVNYTWKYVNRDGSRDLRFSYNKKYPCM